MATHGDPRQGRAGTPGQAVIKARPKLHPVPTELARPFAPVVQWPYIPPLPYQSTANDETQQLPVLDWPQYTH